MNLGRVRPPGASEGTIFCDDDYVALGRQKWGQAQGPRFEEDANAAAAVGKDLSGLGSGFHDDSHTLVGGQSVFRKHGKPEICLGAVEYDRLQLPGKDVLHLTKDMRRGLLPSPI